MTTRNRLGRCPGCGEALSPQHVLIQYRTATGENKAYAECPTCSRVDHPTAALSTQSLQPDPRSNDPAAVTVYWVCNDEAPPREHSTFDSRADSTFHWIAVDPDIVCELNEYV